MYTKRSEEQLVIRTITNLDEREFYGDLICRRHYLGSSQIKRDTLVQVAKLGKEVVAVLTWEPKTRHWFGLRDKLIGWTTSQRKTRHKYCVENRRFLMLVEEKNLASKVLSEATKKLIEEAENIFGHECLLAETFVDPSKQFEGTCYKASGWTEVGMTQGGRGADTRSPKKYFVKELKSEALSKLKAPELAPSDTVNPRQKVLTLQTFDVQSLKRKLDSIEDWRKHQGWYPLSSLLALTIVAVISGRSTISDIHRWVSDLSSELLKSIGCRKVPSYAVIRSTLINTDYLALSAALCSWLEEQENKIYLSQRIKILSLDGKRLRAASNAGGIDIHILELINSVTKVAKAHSKVSDKENEIPVAQQILSEEALDANTIVTADALHTQRKTAEIIQKKNSYYVFAVKDNQKNLKTAILEETPEEIWSPEFHTEELGHGRIEKRSIKIAPLAIDDLDFPGARTIAIITRTTINKKTGATSTEVVPYISNLANPSPILLLTITRLHWTIESSVFCRKDLFYNEDRSTIRVANGPYNMSILRSFAIGLANICRHKSLPNAVHAFQKSSQNWLNFFKIPVGLHAI